MLTGRGGLRGAGRLTSLTLEAAEIVEPPRIRIIRFRILGPLEVQAQKAGPRSRRHRVQPRQPRDSRSVQAAHRSAAEGKAIAAAGPSSPGAYAIQPLRSSPKPPWARPLRSFASGRLTAIGKSGGAIRRPGRPSDGFSRKMCWSAAFLCFEVTFDPRVATLLTESPSAIQLLVSA